MKILVFGNPLVEEDSLALRVVESLREKFPEVEFKEFDSTEDLRKEGRVLRILDVVKGVDKVVELNLDSFESLDVGGIYSMHDFDLGYNLKLLKKLDLIDRVHIIGIPVGCDFDLAVREAERIVGRGE